MKKSILLVIMMFMSVGFLYSQQNQQVKMIEPIFVISDIYLAITALDNVEIEGKEIEAFLDVKKKLKGYMKEAKDQGKSVDDKIKVKMELPIAQNTVAFMARAKISGRMAEQYKRFIDAIVEAAKKG